jgi:hypothetical protein
MSMSLPIHTQPPRHPLLSVISTEILPLFRSNYVGGPSLVNMSLPSFQRASEPLDCQGLHGRLVFVYHFDRFDFALVLASTDLYHSAYYSRA